MHQNITVRLLTIGATNVFILLVSRTQPHHQTATENHYLHISLRGKMYIFFNTRLGRQDYYFTISLGSRWLIIRRVDVFNPVTRVSVMPKEADDFQLTANFRIFLTCCPNDRQSVPITSAKGISAHA